MILISGEQATTESTTTESPSTSMSASSTTELVSTPTLQPNPTEAVVYTKPTVSVRLEDRAIYDSMSVEKSLSVCNDKTFVEWFLDHKQELK